MGLSIRPNLTWRLQLVDFNKNPFFTSNVGRKSGLALAALATAATIAVGLAAAFSLVREEDDDETDDGEPFDMPYDARMKYKNMKESMDQKDETLNVLALNNYMRLINPKPVVYNDYQPHDVTNGWAMKLYESYNDSDNSTAREWLLENEDLILRVYFTEESEGLLSKD